MEQLDCVVIGAGVVGLAIARALARSGRDVTVLEAAPAIGTGTSSRNSEVMHAGLYYATDSLKARLCLQGREALQGYCEQRNIAHRRCGKLIVATHAAQRQKLEALAQQASNNGVNNVRLLERAEACLLEPSLQCNAALLSPDTGILDSHAFMLSLQGDAEREGALFAFQTPLQYAACQNQGFRLHAAGTDFHANTLINSAGLDAPAIAASIDGLDRLHVPEAFYAKGNYFACAVKAPFSRLIYPVPEQAGLGVHLTLDLGGRARFGPDVEWVHERCYQVDASRAQNFYAEIRKYWPGLPNDSLLPDYAGIRPKIAPAGVATQDFRIDDISVHGIPGLINLFGIESPGLTASLAIAEHVATLLVQGA